jgi:hypothetical protein
MFKNKTINNSERFAFWFDIFRNLKKPFVSRLFKKIIFSINVIFIILGIALIVGSYYHVITFNQRLTTKNAVILYRSKLPTNLTVKEKIEWKKLLTLKKRFNKISNSYYLLQVKKLKPHFN